MKHLLFLYNRTCTKSWIKESHILKVLHLILYNNSSVISIYPLKLHLIFQSFNFFGSELRLDFLCFFVFQEWVWANKNEQLHTSPNPGALLGLHKVCYIPDLCCLCIHGRDLDSREGFRDHLALPGRALVNYPIYSVCHPIYLWDQGYH